MLPYIQRWIEEQIERLNKCLDNPKVMQVDQWSEFHLSQKLNSSIKDMRLTQLALEGFMNMLTLSAIGKFSVDGVFEFSLAVRKLEKALRRAYQRDAILSCKKHMKEHMNILNVMRFDALLSELTRLILDNDFIRAEGYINKLITIIPKLHKDEEKRLSYMIYSARAYIATQFNDTNMVLNSINQVLQNGDIEDQQVVEINKRLEWLFDAAKYAASYYEEKSDIDLAVDYLKIALAATYNFKKLIEIQDKLNSLSSPYTQQIGCYAKQKKYQSIILKSRSYPNQLQCFIYFNSEMASNYFKKYLHREGITPQQIPKSCHKKDTDKYAVTFDVSHEFDFEKYILALDACKAIVSKQIKKEDAASKEKSITVTEPIKPIQNNDEQTHLESGLLLSHINSAGSLFKSKRRTQKKRSKPRQANKKPRFFAEMPSVKPLERVEFPRCGLVFDPVEKNNLVALNVAGLHGRAFALINEHLLDYIPIEADAENIKNDFLDNIELSGDMCVPCYKEMKTKGRELKVDLPYFYKIRLLGASGKGDICIYAELLEMLPDGRKLFIFTAINLNAHTRGSRPERIELPEELKERLEIGDADRPQITSLGE